MCFYRPDVVLPVSPTLGRQGQENQQFRVILGFKARFRPAWAVQDPVSKQNPKKSLHDYWSLSINHLACFFYNKEK